MAINSFAQAGLPNTNTEYTPTAVVSTTPTGSFTSGSTTYNYFVFKSSSTLTVSTSGLADVFLVGGGGGGGSANRDYSGGGGGGGGFLRIQNFWMPAGTYSVLIGAGGAQNTDGNVSALVSPTNSSTIALGGGRGGTSNGSGSGSAGGGGSVGSGGGGGSVSAGGTPTSGLNQGNAGKNNGGGGGGAGAAATGATGAIGATTDIITSTIATAQSVGQVSSGLIYFSGGGGTYSANAGGLGGGGTGPNYSQGDAGQPGTPGTANTGGGGAGGFYPGSAGGSGVVIVRVAV